MKPNHDPFEAELTKAMRRVEAPQSLAVYLMNAAEAETHRATNAKSSTRLTPRLFTFRRMPNWLGGAIAAALVAATFASLQQYRHHERTLEAVHQFEASQRITDRALEHTREQLQRAGIQLDQ